MHVEPVILLIPVFNDWESVGLLLPLLERELRGVDARVHALLLDDGSTELVNVDELAERCADFRHLQRVEILRLQRNLGHQRALAVGLSHVAAHLPCSAVVVMDADGEDAPQDVPRLLRELDCRDRNAIIFAERTKRSESLTFRFFYWLYRVAHLLLTGIPVRIGNFSAVPSEMLPRIVVVSELWNHYAASVVKSRLPFETVPTRRANRLAGASKMNLVSLVIHGLSAISVFSERTGVRLIIAGACLALITLVGLGTIATIRLTTDWAVPGWATYTSGLLLLLFGQMLTLILVYVLGILQKRDDAGFLPIRDHVHFVAGTTPIHDQRVGGVSVESLEEATEARR
ncbi:glycosyltransferase [bacterium]|nr:glycosyltransferase [bacterium]